VPIETNKNRLLHEEDKLTNNVIFWDLWI